MPLFSLKNYRKVFLSTLILLITNVLWSNILITEFLASNQRGLEDFEGDTSDWIELYNGGENAVDLKGWYLTNDKDLQNIWKFPASKLIGPKSYLIVFASGKNLATETGEFHTDFKLSSKGEYLALVQPDGITIEHEYKNSYPVQVTDYSYGLETKLGKVVDLISENASLRYWIPVNGNSDSVWMQASFNDSSWSTGTQALGFEKTGTDYKPFINADVAAMYLQATSAYVRIPFTVSNPGEISTLTLSARYDDGFVAYLNGQIVVRVNAPSSLAYNSAATTSNDDAYAVSYEDFDITNYRSLLVDGQNILALQALNLNASSSDLLLQVELTGAVTGSITNLESYFAQPSPGRENSQSIGSIGPLINDVTVPDGPIFQDDVLNITVNISPSLQAVAPETAMLHYRSMFAQEVSIRLYDDGGHHDGGANDGLYGATIPEGVAAPGEMLRWYITVQDVDGNLTRNPRVFEVDPVSNNGGPEYYGTIIIDPDVETFLPVLHWYIQSPTASNTRRGTRCSIYYLNQFYDNVYVRVRGGSTSGQVNPSHKFDLNPLDWFLYDPNEERVEEFNVNSGVSDKSYLRNILANELYKVTGSPSNIAFPIRVEQNGEFYSLDTFIEQTDKRFLRRNHINDEGVLYKAVGNGGGLQADRLDPPDVEKKTHKEELSHQDLKDMVDQFWALGSSGETYMFDHFNMASLINYIAVNSLINNTDYGHKNIYLYYDREDTQEWMLLPWDHDLTMGRTQSPSVFSDGISTTTSPTSPWNRIISSVYDSGRNHPMANQMYWRRLQTMTDQYLIDKTYFTGEIDRLKTLMDPDVTLNYNKWYNPWSWGQDQSFQYALNLITNTYMPGRASYLDGLSITPLTQVLHPGDVSISEVMANPISGNQNEEYVKISNNTSTAMDLSLWTLTSEHFHYVFPGGSVIPSNNSLFVVPDKPAFRNRATSPKAGEKRFVIGHHHQYIDNAGGLFSLKAANGTEWATASYTGVMTDLRKSLRIKEIMYNPPKNDDLYEYILFENIGTTTIDLEHAALVKGVQFTFTTPTPLKPGEQIILVPFSPEDQTVKAQFLAYYPSLQQTIAMAGPFAGKLANEGDQIQIIDQDFDPIQDFAYQTSPPWPYTPNGGGSALVVIDPTGDYSDPANWVKSNAEQSYITWVAAQFTSAESGNPLITGINADPDRDGFPNLLEYAMGLNPKAYDSEGIPSISLTKNGGTIIRLSFPRNANAAGLSINLEQSNNLVGWNAVSATWQRVESTDSITYTSPAIVDTSNLFLRVTVK